jgi:leucyl aminopeptidase (aminopeptidase T)
MKLEKAASKVVSECMGVKAGERVLIITDKNKLTIGRALFDAAKKITSETRLLEIPVGKVNGEEPDESVAQEMLDYGVILIPTSKSFSHTKARRDATGHGVRLATLPGITEEIFMRTMEADYHKVSKLTQKIKQALDKGKMVRIITTSGSDIVMSIEGRECDGGDAFYLEPGSWGNLPAGEACLGPVEGTTNGIFYIDATVLGKAVDKPIKVIVKDGYAIDISGGSVAAELKKTLAQVGKNAFAIAELGIGTNDKAKLTGNTLEDEKVLGTAHIAFGNNKSYGGIIDVPIHIDGVFKKPTIYVDKKKIMDAGKLIL